MAHKETQTERTEKSSSSNLIPYGLAAMANKRIDEYINLQTELLTELQETNRRWFDRAQSEASLASDFVSKLVAARSLPDA